MRASCLTAICMFLLFNVHAQSFEKWLSVRQIGAVALSPDGETTAYTVNSTDWKENTYDAEIWIARKGVHPYQLTRTSKGASSSPAFSPDNKWLAFLADRGDKTQIYIINPSGGEAFPLTKEEEGINTFRWNPDSKMIAFTKNDPESKSVKSNKDRYGAYAVEGTEYRLSHLWTVSFNYDSLQTAGLLPCYTHTDSAEKLASPDCITLPKPQRLTDGNFTIANFEWSPDGKKIAYTRQPDPLINSSIHADIAILDLASRASSTIIANPASDQFLAWSPNSTEILYTSGLTDSTSQYYTNNRLFICTLANKESREIAASFDENKYPFDWNDKGIFCSASLKTKSVVIDIDPATGTVTQVPFPFDIVGAVSATRDGNAMAFTARDYQGIAELYSWKINQQPEKQTDMSAQLKGWNLPVNEVIQWKSKDGTTIEGVLSKPANYDPAKKYPLLVVIHGGPTGVDRPDPLATYVYPIAQWCEKGALVLRVNYRGSAGYGAAFRKLNVRNLGVGDMWDVVSGVESLQKKGMIDTSKMGCMGWSQGGYISAFLTTHTHIFKAISVGAGISDWATYYKSTDITPFAPQYLKATPWDDKGIYEKTSPIAAINNATTPTLIQHGELDRRVPISDAYELYRGLQDKKIPSQLIVYKGFGHGITKPKERLAAVWHNWIWFNKYIWGEDIALPVEH